MNALRRDPGVAFLDLLLAAHVASKKLSECAELSAEEVFCLFILQEHRPQNVKALSSMLGVRSSRMSKILYSLEDRGFVVRSISIVDRRMEEVTLTLRGIDRMEKIVVLSRTLGESLPFSGETALWAPPPVSPSRIHRRSRPLDQEQH